MTQEVTRDVWVPVMHPVTGKRVSVRGMATDRLVTVAAASELEAMINGDSAPDERDRHEDPGAEGEIHG
jgi:hypothetical protein